ncbi:S41 family peptidase [Rhodohalobacter sp. 614A]|uniref:S41 family peptidase n=1 Tax=Rhodohalobacter sp. 614A TaxID=2908649 RepID=UPI001F1922A4|nr:S41 family peptidase [Rhodohalobacter sp. 614A]
MKKVFSISLALLFLSTLLSCKDSSTGSDDEIEEAPQEKQFVWEAMNYWYYWQEQVPKLSDNKSFFENEQDYHNYLMDFNHPEGVFEDLQFNKENGFSEAVLAQFGEDDFSFFIDDYKVFLAQQQGESYNFGFEYGLVGFEGETEIFGYVQYVIPDTPAEAAGIERGDVFSHINGTRLNRNNYGNLLSSSSLELGLADYNNRVITPNGETKTVQAGDVFEDPIYMSKVINTGAASVGYLLYNSFQRNSHQDLNDVFGEFKSQGIDELVLDLRYNGGGAVTTSQLLTSMISGLGSSNEFGRYSFNSKRNPLYQEVVSFLDEGPIYDSEGNLTDATFPINKLSLDRLYVLTSYRTASASESVINSLRAYIDVIVIGDQTVGKDDISLTLFDSDVPYHEGANINPTHNYALQPIVGKLVNRNGESEGEGFLPDYEVIEYEYLENLPPLGDENEPLLGTALTDINGGIIAKTAQTQFRRKAIQFSTENNRATNGMYISPEDLKKLKK